ncbi:MAG: hypothetical protein AAGC65_12570 [Mucilaginibacter sp.]|uniref:hypothetical protein n=1 Tax=Mucilaginibacter sp. TaxID=1882438 RepID=UPI0031A08B5D
MPDIINANDLWVTIVTILFALSMIAERIGNMIKLAIPATRSKQLDDESEKKREMLVMIISILCGLLVSFIAGADLFALISKGVLNAADDFHPKAIAGKIFTGFFISLGSKFWHDMLDIVLQFGNLKKFKVKDKQTDLIKSAQESFNQQKPELEQRADIIKPELQQLQGFRGVMIKQSDAFQPEVSLVFSGEQPDKATKAKLTDHFAPAPVNFVTSALK